MIEIKIKTVDVDDEKSKICVESCAKHLGTLGAFVAEMVAVLEALNKIDRLAFTEAMGQFIESELEKATTDEDSE